MSEMLTMVDAPEWRCPACIAGQHIDIAGEFDEKNEPILVNVATCACWACYCDEPIATELNPKGAAS